MRGTDFFTQHDMPVEVTVSDTSIFDFKDQNSSGKQRGKEVESFTSFLCVMHKKTSKTKIGQAVDGLPDAIETSE